MVLASKYECMKEVVVQLYLCFYRAKSVKLLVFLFLFFCFLDLSSRLVQTVCSWPNSRAASWECLCTYDSEFCAMSGSLLLHVGQPDPSVSDVLHVAGAKSSKVRNTCFNPRPWITGPSPWHDLWPFKQGKSAFTASLSDYPRLVIPHRKRRVSPSSCLSTVCV